MRTTSLRFIAGTCWMIIALATPLRAAVTNYVTTTADSGPGSLRQAIANSSMGDVIEFRTNGVITLLTGELQITNSLTIIGPGATNLAISGNGTSRVLYFSAQSTSSIFGLTIRDGRTMTEQLEARPGGGVYNAGVLSLRYCTIAGNATFFGGHGGGLYNAAGLDLSFCIIDGNSTGNGVTGFVTPYPFLSLPGGPGGSGGGLYNEGTLTLRHCVIRANRTGSGGKGADGVRGAPGECVGGTGGTGGQGGSGGQGGGICNIGAVMIDACVFSDNSTGQGGSSSLGGPGGSSGRWTPYCHPGLAGAGGAAGSGGNGGGFWNERGSVSINASAFVDNVCGMGGMGLTNMQPFFGPFFGPPGFAGPPGTGGSGGGIGNQGTLAVSFCTFVGNSGGINGIYQGGTPGPPGGSGGGVFNGTKGNAIVSACTLSGNTSGNGGGIFNNGSLSIVSSTIASNMTLSAFGGAIQTDAGGCCYSNAVLGNTLIVGNYPFDIVGMFVSKGHNFVGPRGILSGFFSNDCHCDILPSSRIDPRLGPLQDNGGPVPTHALLAGSLAIDAGTNSGAAFDARGQPRTINNPAIQNRFGGDGTDIGAFEANHILTGTEARRVGNDVQVRFTTVSDKTYGVAYRPEVDEGLWTRLPGFVTGTGGIVTYTDTGAATLPRRFYRIFERVP